MPSPVEADGAHGKRSRNYVLIVLLALLVSNVVDRLAFGLLLQDIKLELGLSDTQLGALTGIAFALFYSTLGIPIARWADRGNRVVIIALSAAMWSVMVTICGMATSFIQLLLIRVGTAVGEAGCIPAANSLIGDYFARRERARALSVYMLASPLGAVFGYMVAGWLSERYGWRTTFAILGVPGIGLAALAWLTLTEPRQQVDRKGVEQVWAQTAFLKVLGILWRNATFRHVLLCFSVISFFNYGIFKWQPTFFIRSYGLSTGELGMWLAMIFGIGGLVGTALGGEIASRFAATNERLQLKVMAAACCIIAGLSFASYWTRNLHLAFLFTAFTSLGLGLMSGPLLAIIQSLVHERARATSLAIIYLFGNLIGMGFGPLAAGALSDALRATAGEESLRYSLLLLCPGYFWVAWHALQASRHVALDIERTHLLDRDIRGAE